MRRFLAVLLAAAIILLLIFTSLELLLPSLDLNSQTQLQKNGFHFGVSFCGNTTAEATLLIDRVKNFTNLLVVQSGPVSTNETALNEIVDYAVASGLGDCLLWLL